jgi:hypothetical protein
VALDGEMSQNVNEPNISHVIVQSLDVSTWDEDVSMAVSKLSSK